MSPIGLQAESFTQRTRTREMGAQKRHLICQDIAALEVDVLGMSRGEWNSQQLHSCLLRCSARFVVVAPNTRGDDVGPSVLAAFAKRRHVIPRQPVVAKLLTAVEAQVAVALKQRAIAQRRGVTVAELVVAMCRDDRVDLDRAAPMTSCVDAAVEREQRFTTDVGNHIEVVQTGGLPEINPLQRHTRRIGTQNLLRQARHGSAPLMSCRVMAWMGAGFQASDQDLGVAYCTCRMIPVTHATRKLLSPSVTLGSQSACHGSFGID